MRLAVSKNSFHYKYQEVLRNIWGIRSAGSKVKSLCVYSQFIFWFTFFTVLISPLLIIGWTTLKMLRGSYKFLSFSLPGRVVLNFFDKVLPNILDDPCGPILLINGVKS